MEMFKVGDMVTDTDESGIKGTITDVYNGNRKRFVRVLWESGLATQSLASELVLMKQGGAV